MIIIFCGVEVLNIKLCYVAKLKPVVVATLMAYIQQYLLTFRKLKPILSMTFEKHKTDRSLSSMTMKPWGAKITSCRMRCK